ncbi:MAG TPA: hypothetical protein PK771_10100 [Spirochaetota bacterium]|nr:hypothetical protein [Spirochaetota bacterium]
MDEIKKLIETRIKNYSEISRRSKFMLESYIGGFTYKNSNNLHKYTNEPTQKYDNRLKRCFSINLLAPLVDEIKNAIFSKDIVRDGENNEYLNRFINSATIDGKDLDDFMKKIAIYGAFLKIGVLIEGVDKSKFEKLDIKTSIIDKELKEENRLFPNAKIFLPHQILNYSISDSEINWILLDYSYFDNKDFFNQKEVKKYVLYTKDYWRSFTYTDNNEVIEESFEHKLGVIPFAFFTQKDIDGNDASESIYDDIALQQNNIFNYYSLIDESLYSAIFTYLLVQEPDLNLITDLEQKKQLKEKPFDIKENVLSYAHDCNPPSLLKNDFVNIPIVLELIDKITKEIHRKVGKFLDNNNYYAQSGTAKTIDNEQRNQNIINYSIQLQEIENWMLRIFYLYETGEKMPEDFESIYPDDFATFDINERLDSILKLKNIYLDKSQTAVNLILSTFFKEIMRNKVTKEQIDTVEQQINTENSYNPLLIDMEEEEVKEGA